MSESRTLNALAPQGFRRIEKTTTLEVKDVKNIVYRIMEFFAGAALIVAACIVVVNILLGKLAGTPLKGTYEMVGLCCCIMASMAIPMATLTGGHVAVDILVRAFKTEGQMVFDIIARIVDALVGVALCYAAGRFALRMLATKETTATLNIPVWPFRFVWMLGCALVVIFSAYNLIQIPKKYKNSVLSSADAEIAAAKKAAEEIYGTREEKGGEDE